MANQASQPDPGAKREPTPKPPDPQAVEYAAPARDGPDLPPVPDLSERERHEQRMLDHIESGRTAYDARRKASAEMSKDRRGKSRRPPETQRQQDYAAPGDDDAAPDGKADDPQREGRSDEPDLPPVPDPGGRKRNLQTIGIKRRPSRRNKGGGIKLGLIQHSDEHMENQERSRRRRRSRSNPSRSRPSRGDGGQMQALMDGQAEIYRVLLEILEALRW